MKISQKLLIFIIFANTNSHSTAKITQNDAKTKIEKSAKSQDTSTRFIKTQTYTDIQIYINRPKPCIKLHEYCDKEPFTPKSEYKKKKEHYHAPDMNTWCVDHYSQHVYEDPLTKSFGPR